MKTLKFLTPLMLLAGIGLGATSASAQSICAREGGNCHAPAGSIIMYGARGAYARRRSPPGGLPCNNHVFGDPLVGIGKHCRIVFPRYY